MCPLGCCANRRAGSRIQPCTWDSACLHAAALTAFAVMRYRRAGRRRAVARAGSDRKSDGAGELAASIGSGVQELDTILPPDVSGALASAAAGSRADKGWGGPLTAPHTSPPTTSKLSNGGAANMHRFEARLPLEYATMSRCGPCLTTSRFLLQNRQVIHSATLCTLFFFGLLQCAHHLLSRPWRPAAAIPYWLPGEYCGFLDEKRCPFCSKWMVGGMLVCASPGAVGICACWHSRGATCCAVSRLFIPPPLPSRRAALEGEQALLASCHGRAVEQTISKYPSGALGQPAWKPWLPAACPPSAAASHGNSPALTSLPAS